MTFICKSSEKSSWIATFEEAASEERVLFMDIYVRAAVLREKDVGSNFNSALEEAGELTWRSF